LERLRHFSVDIIELGVQSLDDSVLRSSNRGHDSAIVFRSAALIKSYGFELGIQLMIGLPGDSHEKSIETAKKTVLIGPAIARIYPTIIIKETVLEQRYLSGDYRPLSLEDAVGTAKEMYTILKSAGIQVIRIGLKSSDHIADGQDILGDTFHPAFRQLVESALARDIMEAQLLQLLSLQPASAIDFSTGTGSFSDMIGNRKSNKLYFESRYPLIRFSYHTDPSIENGCYKASIR
jgi:histone acetyltransferase (RNA polymerase elongator complex component)